MACSTQYTLGIGKLNASIVDPALETDHWLLQAQTEGRSKISSRARFKEMTFKTSKPSQSSKNVRPRDVTSNEDPMKEWRGLVGNPSGEFAMGPSLPL